MRALFTTHPGFGHFHPLVPLARALQQAGHEVAFATAAPFLPVITGNDLRGFAAGADWSTLGTSMEEMQKRQASVGGDLVARRAFMMELFVNKFGRQMLPDLVQVCRAYQPDVIIRDSVEFSGCVAAEHLGIPHASIQVGAGHPAFLRAPDVAAYLDGLRGAVGLPADPAIDMLFRYLHLCFAPPLYFSDPPLPSTVHCFQPAVFDQSGEEGLPAWTESLGSRPVVYATLGTVFNKLFHPFSAILKGLATAEVELIVTVGRDLDPAALGPQPPHVHIERYIPQTLLFPRCSAAILHGGYNSTIAALWHGLPLVIVPLAADQPLNAERCRQLGVAQIIPPHELTPERVRSALDTVLGDPSYKRNAERFQVAARALPDLSHAVGLLERLAKEKRPQLRV